MGRRHPRGTGGALTQHPTDGPNPVPRVPTSWSDSCTDTTLRSRWSWARTCDGSGEFLHGRFGSCRVVSVVQKEEPQTRTPQVRCRARERVSRNARPVKIPARGRQPAHLSKLLTDKYAATGSVTNVSESPEARPESEPEGGSPRRLETASWVSDSLGVVSSRRGGDRVRLCTRVHIGSDPRHWTGPSALDRTLGSSSTPCWRLACPGRASALTTHRAPARTVRPWLMR